MQRKISQTRAEAEKTPVFALAHGGISDGDVRRRLKGAWDASPAGNWVNRYGYLSDAKLIAIGEITQG